MATKKRETNKKIGSDFEKKLAEHWSKLGWWVHLVEPAKDGSQPCDLVACKSDEIFLIDCKTLDTKTGAFSLSRLEENQWLAIEKWIKTGNRASNYVFAIYWNNRVYYVSANVFIRARGQGKKSISLAGEAGVSID